MDTGNHLVDGADNEEWLNRPRKEKHPSLRLQPIKPCGCARYEHCQRCEEEIL